MSDEQVAKPLTSESTPETTPTGEWLYTSETPNAVRCAVCGASAAGLFINVATDGGYHYHLPCGHDEGILTVIADPKEE
jgi:hypothetical protein